MKNSIRIIMLLLLQLQGLLYAQDTATLINEGNQYYRNQQYDKAETSYRQALNIDPANDKAAFNLASTLARQGKKAEAVTAFGELAGKTKDNNQRAAAWYNKGVLLQQTGKLEEAVEAWKASLRLNPEDQQARENLQKALLELKKKNAQKKKEQKDPQKKPKPQPQPKMSQKEAEQRLKLLEQKEKELNQRMQQEKTKSGSNQSKDW